MPPATVSLKAVVPWIHIDVLPVITAAKDCGSTVISWVVEAVPQNCVTVYDIVTLPTANPFTTPKTSTLAMAESLLLQVPPVGKSLNITWVVIQTVDGPL